MSTLYPVPQPSSAQLRPPAIQLVVFLPETPPATPEELPPLVMAPMAPQGWPRF